MTNLISSLEKDLYLSYNQLKAADETIKQLKSRIKNKDTKMPNEITMNINDLKVTHTICEEDKKNYKEDIKKLTAKLKEGEKRINELKQENANLKKMHEKKNNDKYNKSNISIKNTTQLSKILGFQSKKSGEIKKEHEAQNISQKNNLDKKNDNKLYNNKKTEFEKKFNEFKDKSNRFIETIEDLDNLISDYKKYLNEVNQNMNNFREGINISLINSVNINVGNNEQQKKMDEIYQKIEKISLSLVNIDDTLLNIKNNFLKNIENLLDNIFSELKLLDMEENQNEYNFNNITQMINSEFNEIQKIFDKFWKDNNNFYERKNDIEEEMKELKYQYRKYEEEYKKQREKARLEAIKNEEINNNNYNNNVQIGNIDFNNINNNDINTNEKDSILGESFMFKTKGKKLKEDLYKTVNIFKETEDDKLMEQFIDEAQILRKNYHVLCYVYDDFDVYDIYYDLKAVGLRRGEFFRKSSHGFYYDKDIEIQSFSIDGREYPFIHRKHYIEYEINLYNSQKLKIHILYKSSKNKNFLTHDELNERNIYRNESYGLDKSLSGQKAKFSLILKGNYDIVNFSEYFLIRNNNNKNEVEYMWGGTVPYGGLTTNIMFSKKEATWSFNFSVKLSSNSYLRNTMFYVPIEFIGGNNEIININASSPQSTNCILDEESRQYTIEFFNTKFKEGEFSIGGILKNKCKGEWEIDLTNEEIENLMPQEDRLCKEQLKYIAKNIINEFDKKNKNNDFIFHDYMKIGFWVKENIKYDLNYSGEIQYSAIDIYNIKKGVCHHFTKLSNALLYSLGYQVLYASGYVCKGNNSFKTSTGHAWSLIKLNNNKWYPFDSTWGILTGKLPISHIFSSFTGKHIYLRGIDHATINKSEMEGAFIE